MKEGDLVRPAAGLDLHGKEFGYGIILDVWEDDYGIYYYEVCWTNNYGWWKSDELEMISEAG